MEWTEERMREYIERQEYPRHLLPRPGYVGKHFTMDQRWTILEIEDRKDGPGVLWLWWENNELSTPELRELLPHVWTEAEWPGLNVGQRGWVGMFKDAGFLVDQDDTTTQAPTEPLTVWRGAPERYARGLSWTFDRDRAFWFAKTRNTDFFEQPSEVYETTVPPHHVFAIFHGREESEVVVNPNGLRGQATPKQIG